MQVCGHRPRDGWLQARRRGLCTLPRTRAPSDRAAAPRRAAVKTWRLGVKRCRVLGRRLGSLGWGSGTATPMHAHASRRPRWRPLGMVMVTTHIYAKPQHLSLFGPWGFSTMLEWSIHSVASECVCGAIRARGRERATMRCGVRSSRSRVRAVVRAVRVACWARVQPCRGVVCVCVSHLQILHFLRYHLSYHPPAPLPRAHTPRPLPRARRGSPSAQPTSAPIQVHPAASSRSHR